MNTQKVFKSNLLKLMGVHNMTQLQLSLEADISLRTIGYWLGERASLPSINILLKLANIFETTIEALLQ